MGKREDERFSLATLGEFGFPAWREGEISQSSRIGFRLTLLPRRKRLRKMRWSEDSRSRESRGRLKEFDMHGNSTRWFVGHPGWPAGKERAVVRNRGRWGISIRQGTRRTEKVYKFLDVSHRRDGQAFPDHISHGGDAVNGKSGMPIRRFKVSRKPYGTYRNNDMRCKRISAAAGRKLGVSRRPKRCRPGDRDCGKV